MLLHKLDADLHELTQDVQGNLERLGMHNHEELCLFAAKYALMAPLEKTKPSEPWEDVAAAMIGGFLLGLNYYASKDSPES